MRINFLLIITILFTIGVLNIQAQENVNPTGGNVSNSHGSVSYSVGQIVFQTYSDGNISVAEGVQQAFEISEVSIEDVSIQNSLKMKVYPNPTVSFLILEVGEFLLENLYYQLYDIQGNIIQKGAITDFQTNLNLENLSSASYFLKITNNNEILKIYKIIKN